MAKYHKDLLTNAKRIPVFNLKEELINDKEPEGTDEEMQDAFLKANDTKVRILNYQDDKEGLSKERLEFLKRYMYFLRHGPRKGYDVDNRKAKLTQPEVFYILTSNVSAKGLSKILGVSPNTVSAIRKGLVPGWVCEYRMMKRLKQTIRSDLKFRLNSKYCYYIQNIKTGELVAICSGKNVAKRYLREYLIYQKKMKAKDVDNKFKNDTIYLDYKIERQAVIKES